MTPLVTIGIPCFNNARWLRQAIESALSQTWPAVEVIVSDDGSTDDSVAIAQSFGDRIRVLTGPNRGANHARNEVLANARGDWLQYLDADDYLEPPKIARQFEETARGADADMIYSATWMEDLGAETRRPSALDTSLDLFCQWLTWQLPQTGGCLWRKSALTKLGGWKEGQPCCQEHELYLRALQARLRFVHAPAVHAAYRIWSEQTICRRDPRLVIRVRTGLIDELLLWLEQRDLWTKAHAHAAGRACFEMARTLAKFDLREAATYHRERNRRGLIHLDGPAAPPSYRLAYRLLGFTGAETLAAVAR